MEKDVKIVIGANYGDEGKGLMTRHFVLDAKENGKSPIVIFSNGTAQRGHTVDYNENSRHIYHHFGSGTGDGVPTFFAEDFFIHPMEFHREYEQLCSQNIYPRYCFADPKAKVITPFDMLVDRLTEEQILLATGERQYGSCAYGSWCAIEDRYPLKNTDFTIGDFKNMIAQDEAVIYMLEQIWKDCLSILYERGIDIERTSYAHLMNDRTIIINNFIDDLRFFFSKIILTSFYNLYNDIDGYNYYIFENGQGLGLDKDVLNDYHTTSKTGVLNPYNMLKYENGFNAEVCYVTRSYITRHGDGPLKEETKKSEITDNIDKTNTFNIYQGNLRYAYYNDKEQQDRIDNDMKNVNNDKRFTKTLAITHCNEFNCEHEGDYSSYNPFEIIKNK